LGIAQHYLNSDGYNDVPQHLRGDPDYSIPRYLEELGFSGRVGFAGGTPLNLELSMDLYRDKRGEGEKVQSPEGGYRSFDNEHLRFRLFGEQNGWQYSAGFYYMHEAYTDLNERIRGGDYIRFDVLSDRYDYGGTVQLGSRFFAA
jgi:iron complex outermembrane receptor protein